MRAPLYIFLLLLPVVVYATMAFTIRSDGAPPGHTGAPIDNNKTCSTAGCHSGTLKDGGPSTPFQISISSPQYTPGVPLDITVTMDEAGLSNYSRGFQITVVRGNAYAGTLTVSDNVNTRLATGSTNYITHTDAGRAQKQWTVRWGPDDQGGDVVIYAAGLSNFGSNVYRHNLTVSEALNQAPTASFTANPMSGTAPLSVNFNAGASSDPDGSIQSYEWNFGDGANGSGVSVNHTYGSPGTYTATLTVTDNRGAQNAATSTIVVGTPALTQAPVLVSPEDSEADLQLNPTLSWQAVGGADGYQLQIAISSDFSASSIVEDVSLAGSILSANVSGLIKETTYYWRVRARNAAGPGPWSEIRSFTTVARQAPTASFTAIPVSGTAPLTVSFNATASSDLDGSIHSYAWDFDDGTNGSGVSVNHTYGSPGTYTATLTVTDNEGLQNTATVEITVEMSTPVLTQAPVLISPADSATGLPLNPTLSWQSVDGADGYQLQVAKSSNFSGSSISLDVSLGGGTLSAGATGLTAGTIYYWRTRGRNAAGPGPWSEVRSFTTAVIQAPTASFTANPTNGPAPLSVSFDASSSSAPNGAIKNYLWTFGDGGFAFLEAPTTMHTYRKSGTYDILLEVVDNLGATGSAATTIVVAEATASEVPTSDLPQELSIESLYPNPFNPSVTMTLAVPSEGQYHLKIVDMVGRIVDARTVYSNAAGRIQISFGLESNASGTILISARSESTGRVVTARAVLLK